MDYTHFDGESRARMPATKASVWNLAMIHGRLKHGVDFVGGWAAQRRSFHLRSCKMTIKSK